MIQKFVKAVPPERLSFLKIFRGAALQLAIHPYGCRVLQRCLEYLPSDYCHDMIDELLTMTGILMQDRFGVCVFTYLEAFTDYVLELRGSICLETWPAARLCDNRRSNEGIGFGDGAPQDCFKCCGTGIGLCGLGYETWTD